MTSNALASDLENILERTEGLWPELRRGRVLITGATGFFGCWLLESFAWINRRLGLGAKAVGLSRHPETLRATAPHLAEDSSLSFLAGDVRDHLFPDARFTHVIHAATEASAALNADHPQLMFDTIVQGTRNVLRHAGAAGECRFLLASSGAVYGVQPPQISHVQESFPGAPDPLEGGSAYAEGKRAAELLCALSATSSFQPTIARCFAFVGPYMKLNAHFAIGNFIADRLRGGPIRVQGDGTPFRSYMYASDLMVWLWTILFRGQSARAYNVGSEEALDIAATARNVAEAVPPMVEVHIAGKPKPGTLPARYVPCTRRVREELGVRLEVPVVEAVRRTYLWFARQVSYD